MCTVNFIRGRVLNHRLFQKFCDEIRAEHSLYQTKVLWLNRGRVFARILELRNEILEFFKQQQSPLSDHFEDEHFIVILRYLADIFSLLNDLNICREGIWTFFKPGEKLYLQGNRLSGVTVLKAETWQTFQSLTISLLEMIKHYL